jgi:pimeloyl-ACP methyl ester carboxylesterase
MPKVRVGNITLHYLSTGTGPDVVMVHGLAANLAFWGLRIVPLPAARFKVTVYDLRGHGHSEMPPRGYTSSQMVDDLDALLRALGIDRAHLVGHSFGGAVALEFAVRHPERVESLTLADAVLFGVLHARVRPNPERWAALHRWLAQSGVPVPRADSEHALGLLAFLADLEPDQRLRPRADEAFVPFALWRRPAGAAGQWRRLLANTSAVADFATRPALTREQLRTVSLPTLAIYGELSRYRPMGRALERTIPGCRARLVNGAGHFHPLVRPAGFADELSQFLAAPASHGANDGGTNRG